MRESFVIHAEYIEDLPDEYKQQFLSYIYNYGVLEEVPILEGLEKSLWVKIQRRIDMDIDAYSKRVEYQKLYYEKKKLEKNNKDVSTFSMFTNVENVEKVDKDNSSLQMFSPNSRRDIDIEFEFDNEFDIEFDIDTDIDAKKSPQLRYSDMLFQKWKDASLPGSKDSISFFQKEFKNAILSLKGIHSKDVLGACDNYISVINNPQCYLKNKWPFDRFVSSKVFTDFLPDRFDISNFKRFDLKEGITADSAELDKYDFKKIQVGG